MSKRDIKGSKEKPEETEELKTAQAKKDTFFDSLVVAVVIAMLIKGLLLQTYQIPSESMVGTLLKGDYILLNRLAYIFSEPERNDVVVFEYPLEPSKDFIKRVIGTPGDKIELKDKVLYVNGQAQPEPFKQLNGMIPLPADISPKDSFTQITVPEGYYFMMGDNRDNSYDSRFWGFVDEDAIKGKAVLIYWSLETPAYDSAWAKFPLSMFRFLNPAYDRFERFFKPIR
ncbi:signal peptidase I [Seleniivibrio woodruffii]|uniref:Signal peptidase I n=1 Tax=Seleniivibrio woodruffii TaxID=1078050 RepID=A0A4R1KE64_9BACT|nr:signal peptidase I [Seleniivibrio woodruffii]TCK62407.1 signal peptidase I [Seleniivibrio woodruffii]TVZ34475.1 signal peptidase I [Seleniivibrio woodruffii]